MPPKPTRQSLTIDEVTDVYDTRWIVSEYRPTTHGFDVAIGWQVDATAPGNPRIIMTAALAEYLQSVERPRDVDLPISPEAIKRLRKQLSIQFDWDKWWGVRADDLASMTLREFARKHRCSEVAASQRRAALAKGE